MKDSEYSKKSKDLYVKDIGFIPGVESFEFTRREPRFEDYIYGEQFVCPSAKYGIPDIVKSLDIIAEIPINEKFIKKFFDLMKC